MVLIKLGAFVGLGRKNWILMYDTRNFGEKKIRSQLHILKCVWNVDSEEGARPCGIQASLLKTMDVRVALITQALCVSNPHPDLSQQSRYVLPRARPSAAYANSHLHTPQNKQDRCKTTTHISIVWLLALTNEPRGRLDAIPPLYLGGVGFKSVLWYRLLHLRNGSYMSTPRLVILPPPPG